MTPKELDVLGLKESELQELKDMWIAVLWNRKTQNADLLKDEADRVIASKNPLDVQLKASELYPELFNERGKAKFDLGHVPAILTSI